MGHPIKVNTIKELNSKVSLYCKLVDVKAEDVMIELSGDFHFETDSKKTKPQYMSRVQVEMVIHRNWNIVEYEYFYSDPFRNGSDKLRKIRQIRGCWIRFGEK